MGSTRTVLHFMDHFCSTLEHVSPPLNTAVVDPGFRWRCVALTIQSAADGVRSIDCPESEVHQGDSLIAQHDLNSPGIPSSIMAAGEVIVAHTNAAHVVE